MARRVLNVHVAPGLGNAIGALYTAHVSGTPLIVTAGQQEQGHGLTEPLLYAPLVPIAAPVVKWATEVTRLADLPRIMHRAAKVAALAYEDEKYSYVAMSRHPGLAIAARVIGHPRARHGHVDLDLCTPDGLRLEMVSRSDRDRYRRAQRH